MYEVLRNRALALLKVPPEPHPPLGDPASLRVFRAGRNYYRLRLTGWAVAQVFALAGIVFWTGMLIEVERRAKRAEAADMVSASTTEAAPAADTVVTPRRTHRRDPRFDAWRDRFAKNVRVAAADARADKTGLAAGLASGWSASRQVMVEVARITPLWVFPLVWALKIIGIVLYLFQLAFSYATRRLDYEMRWYMVTDRSLRLRHGVWTVQESTMSFANIQQVVISQDPLQRLLGLANVKVQSAGGGSGDERHGGEDMHVGYFHSVTNAEEIRDLMLERLRRFRESGLGDPDEKSAATPAMPRVAPAIPRDTELHAAACELATEARALREVLTSASRL